MPAWLIFQVPSALTVAALLTTLVVLACTCWLISGNRCGPNIPSCDLELFYWEARRSLGRYFHTFQHGNRVSNDGIKEYAWAIPNKAALACIARHLRSLPRSRRHVVDFGAGGGYWSLQTRRFSHVMALEGVRVTALDKHPELYSGKTWYRIERGDVDDLESLTDVGMLLLVWPPCWEDMATKAVRGFSGDLIAYVGEARGGATAWGTFFDVLDKDWIELEQISIPNWHGRSDCLFIYQRAALVSCTSPLAEQNDTANFKHDSKNAEAVPGGFGKPSAISAKGSTPTELLLPFFRGTGTDTEGRRLSEIREYDFQRMEFVHNYVQWMFPTDEASMFNMDAPILTPSLQRAFKEDPILRRELRLNLVRFCAFLGLEFQEEQGGQVKIVIGSNFQERAPDCWSSMFGSNHNWLRITRVLNCLGLCSFPAEQSALMMCLEDIFQKGLAKCASAIPHWRQKSRAVPLP